MEKKIINLDYFEPIRHHKQHKHNNLNSNRKQIIMSNPNHKKHQKKFPKNVNPKYLHDYSKNIDIQSEAYLIEEKQYQIDQYMNKQQEDRNIIDIHINQRYMFSRWNINIIHNHHS